MRAKAQKNNLGQGLLETIVALGIIVSGVVGMVSLTLSNQISSADSSERLIAANLAREGVEVARNIRDTNWLACEIAGGVLGCNDWDEGLTSVSDPTAVLLFDVDNNAWSLDFTPNDISHDYARIWRRTSGSAALVGAHFQSAEAAPVDSVLTSYRRLLSLYEICADKTPSVNCPPINPKIGIRVQSNVQWETQGKVNELTFEERLFNWR